MESNSAFVTKMRDPNAHQYQHNQPWTSISLDNLARLCTLAERTVEAEAECQRLAGVLHDVRVHLAALVKNPADVMTSDWPVGLWGDAEELQAAWTALAQEGQG